MRNRSAREGDELGEGGWEVEGAHVFRNSFSKNQCVLQSEMVKRAIIAQEKLEICCKFS